MTDGNTATKLVPISPELAEGAFAIGRTTTFTKTVGESDIYLFAGVSGDLGPNHVDEEYMSKTRYGHRIAHGVLIVSYMSTCSSKLIEEAGNEPAVSYGYDRVRFVKPVFIGDTVTVTYTVAERDDELGEIRSQVTAQNQHGDVVAVATHILRRV
ncbi:MaoC family dehydratase N-terminal domain-containing protein [Amycolatopsis acidiphila]|uniref:Dehydratase n=1 Tax=Amycolatopsis acidiphila TaxID=715473 RepID=A0A558AJB1_9PSEU|nr:MaoC/PaaZ C-terminal domain-containing protein [Amycolatopsis acidiphila]TVT24347.1 dehydratase [Amycolatopsis acidiphila]UIJ62516.1 MaoC family dehydratase N-terminal domain-containing protein [Amycolatopsis acidiphila]GHG85151.1 MaoC family dehydratase [Amycolatopsis acidiphila]